MGQPVCDDEFDWAIVGGGLFATAIAHALARRKGNERIIWCKGDKRRSTASSDISKIVRTRYPLPGYTLWAKEALIKWKSDETFKKFFHDCGGIRVEGLESSDERMQEMVWSDHKPDLKPDETLRLDESIGSVDFKSALDAAADEASKLGVEIREEDVTKLLVQDGTRVEVSTGEIVWAKKIIVATGPWTPGLLENSGVIFPDNFFKVVAVPVATMRLEDEESEERIKDEERPIIMTNNGEILWSKKDKSLKISSTDSFPIEHPDKIKKPVDINSNRALLGKMLPQYSLRELESWHCSDLMTPQQHPLLDVHPKNPNLLFAVGGNFHCAKFLPEGEVMLRVLESRGKEQTHANDPVLRFLLKSCGWDRTVGGQGAHENMVPSGNSNTS